MNQKLLSKKSLGSLFELVLFYGRIVFFLRVVSYKHGDAKQLVSPRTSTPRLVRLFTNRVVFLHQVCLSRFV